MIFFLNRQKEMSFPVFETGFAKNNQSVLRWASVAVAAVLSVIVLVWAAVIWTKDTFKQDVEMELQMEREETGGNSMFGTSKTWRLMTIAFCFLFVVASTFLSWYVAALHVVSDNLIAFDVLQILSVILLCMGSYFWYKQNRVRSAAMSCYGFAAVLEFVALIVLITSPTIAGPNGVTTQSSLYVPLFIATLSALGMATTLRKRL